MFEVGYSVIAASSSVGGPTANPPAHSAMELTAAANIRTAYERAPQQTHRSIFGSRVKKSSRLYVDKLGWPNGVPRIANLDDEPRRPKSYSNEPHTAQADRDAAGCGYTSAEGDRR